MKYEKMIKDILGAIGGKENIESAAHCMTRLRLTLKDDSKVEEETIKNIDGVMGLVNNGQQTQIVIGPNVANVYKEFIEIYRSKFRLFI